MWAVVGARLSDPVKVVIAVLLPATAVLLEVTQIYNMRTQSLFSFSTALRATAAHLRATETTRR